jgi:hypothetical protein
MPWAMVNKLHIKQAVVCTIVLAYPHRAAFTPQPYIGNHGPTLSRWARIFCIVYKAYTSVLAKPGGGCNFP